MDWAKKRRTELEIQLRTAYAALIKNRRVHTRIRKSLDFNPRHAYVAGDPASISSFLKWFSEVGALNIAEIRKKAQDGRWVRRFTQPSPAEKGNLNLQDPSLVMHSVKNELKNHLTVVNAETRSIQNTITAIRQQLHQFDVEEENRTYGKESVRLTRVNILMSILIPIVTFLIGLALSVLMEAAKPEIITWLRAALKLGRHQ